MLDVRSEDQILICVARHSADPATTEQLREMLESDLDWTYLLAAAERHCLTPLLYRSISATTGAVAPAQALQQLQKANHENTNSNLLLTGELVKLLDFLQANAIQAIPFKGPTLALAAYGDIGLRQFADLDILIHKGDLGKIRQLLSEQGYTSHLELNRSQEAALSRFDCAWNFVNAKNVTVDVHWDVVDRRLAFALDTNGLWDRLQPVTVAGKQLSMLATEDLLLVLCIHGFTHFWERLGWVCDVAGLLEQGKQINWQLLMQNAERSGNRRILLLGLLLASDLLQAPVPPDILKVGTRDAAVTNAANRVKDSLFINTAEFAGMLNETRMLVSLRESKRDRLKSFFSLLLTPRSGDWMLVSVPGPLAFLYYLIRPLRLAGKYGSHLVTTRNGRGDRIGNGEESS